jgi:hypothetical protein
MEPEDLLPYCSQEYASFQVFINLPFMIILSSRWSVASPEVPDS